MPEGKQENKSFRVDLDFQTFRFRLLSRARRRAEVKSGGGRQSWAQTERGAIRDKSLKSASISLEEKLYIQTLSWKWLKCQKSWKDEEQAAKDGN